MSAADRSARRLNTEAVVQAAGELGLDRVGVVTVSESDHGDFFEWWLAQDYHGEMKYLARDDALARRRDLRETLAGFRSAVVVAQEYGNETPGPVEHEPSRAIIARYARGRDYHRVLAARIEALSERLQSRLGEFNARAYVDTGPVLERELAQRAGLGWFGRNTMLIHPRSGSYAFLGVLLTDLALDPTEAFEEDHCGTCTRCLEACPTGALLGRTDSGAPVMDARRCISYLTIELRGPIPEALRPAIGNRIFGCDICQEVCPFNQRFSPKSRDPAYDPHPDLDGVSMVALAERLLDMSGKQVQRVFADSPLYRPGRKGLLRNLCVGLGNYGASSAGAAGEVRPVLERAGRDASELVREHAAWALDRIGASSGGEEGRPSEVSPDPP